MVEESFEFAGETVQPNNTVSGTGQQVVNQSVEFASDIEEPDSNFAGLERNYQADEVLERSFVKEAQAVGEVIYGSKEVIVNQRRNSVKANSEMFENKLNHNNTSSSSGNA